MTFVMTKKLFNSFDAVPCRSSRLTLINAAAESADKAIIYRLKVIIADAGRAPCK